MAIKEIVFRPKHKPQRPMPISGTRGYRDGASYPVERLPDDYADLWDMECKLRKAAHDAAEMGWNYLYSYFVGKLDVVERVRLERRPPR